MTPYEPSVMYPYIRTRRQNAMSTMLWWTSVTVALVMLGMLTMC